jgi:hypothetical protein
VRSWDEAFGRPFPKGLKLRKARDRINYGYQIWIEVQLLHDKGKAIGEELFHEVGSNRKPPMKASTVRDMYYAYDKDRHIEIAKTRGRRTRRATTSKK